MNSPEYNRAYYQSHRKMNSPEYNQAYYQSHKKAMDASHRRWAKSNPLKIQGYQRTHDLKRSQEIQEFILAEKNKPCTDCGRSFPPICMDFDHLPGTVKVDCVSRMVSSKLPVQQLKEETSKCEVVCSNCHRLRTQKRRLCQKKISNL